MDELVEEFGKEFVLVSCLFGTITSGVWFVDSGASRHITGFCEIFISMAKEQRNLHVELIHDAKYVVKGIGNIQFQMESRDLMEVKK